MKPLTIALNPREWLHTLALALCNSFVGLGQVLRNPRLWIGIGASLLVHGAIILLSLEYNGKAVGEDPDGIWEIVVSSGTDHPNVTKVLEPIETPPGVEEGINRPIKSSAADELQAMTKNTIDPTDISAVEPHGVIYLTEKQLSSETLQGLEPITGIRSKGGVVLPGIGPLEGPIDPTGRVVIGPAIEKPVTESNTTPSEVKEPTSGKGTRFSLEGDLSPSDIVSSTLPRYPNFARAKGLTNVVIVIDFTANQGGDVAPTMVIKRSTGYPQWDEEVKATLRSWKFTSSDKIKRSGRITFKFVLT